MPQIGRLGFLWGVAAAMALVCCGSDPLTPAPAPPAPAVPTATIAEVCLTACTRAHECSPAVDAQICASDCSNHDAALEGKWRPDLLYIEKQCLEERPCSVVLKPAEYFSNCIETATSSIGATEEAVEVCNALEEALTTRCGATFDPATCLHVNKRFTSAALQATRECSTQPCALVDGCLRRAAGVQDPALGAP